jgi:hypothetical protein
MLQTILRKLAIETEVSHLAAGMNSCIGATCTMDPDILPQQIRQGLFDHLLDRAGIALALPAGVAATTIGENQGVRHRLFHSIIKANGSQIRA